MFITRLSGMCVGGGVLLALGFRLKATVTEERRLLESVRCSGT